MSFLRLSGPRILQLRDRLNAAFLSLETFDELLLRLDRTVSNYAGPNDPLPTTILKTVRHANAELWWRDLLREACNAVPDPQLRSFSDQVGFAPDFIAADDGGEALLKGRELELKIEDRVRPSISSPGAPRSQRLRAVSAASKSLTSSRVAPVS